MGGNEEHPLIRRNVLEICPSVSVFRWGATMMAIKPSPHSPHCTTANARATSWDRDFKRRGTQAERPSNTRSSPTTMLVPRLDAGGGGCLLAVVASAVFNLCQSDRWPPVSERGRPAGGRNGWDNWRADQQVCWLETSVLRGPLHIGLKVFSDETDCNLAAINVEILGSVKSPAALNVKIRTNARIKHPDFELHVAFD